MGVGVSSSLLRLALIIVLLGLSWLGESLGWRDDPVKENHPAVLLLSILNDVFKSVGWLLSAICWALLLVTRYWRQVRLEENASWRRHAAVDGVLWVLSSFYWAACVYFAFGHIARHIGSCRLAGESWKESQVDEAQCVDAGGQWTAMDVSGHAFLASLAILLLTEETIRWLTGPINLFIFPSHRMDYKTRRAKLAWYFAVGISWVVTSLWMVLYIRTALWYHTLEEKVLGTALATLYYSVLLTTRLLLR